MAQAVYDHILQDQLKQLHSNTRELCVCGPLAECDSTACKNALRIIFEEASLTGAEFHEVRRRELVSPSKTVDQEKEYAVALGIYAGNPELILP